MNVNGVCLFCFVFPLFSGESNVLPQYSMTGETVHLHLQKKKDVSYSDIRWKHNYKLIASSERPLNSSTEVLSNGTLLLRNIQKNYSGVYFAEAFDEQGKWIQNSTYELIVIEPPVVELIVCINSITVFHCMGENGPDAVYEWTVSTSIQGGESSFNQTGKHVSLNNTSGNISCTLQKGVFRAQSDPYTFYCAGLQQETGQEWCFSAGITLILVLCLMIAGCSFTIQTYCKRDNLNVQSDASHIEVTQDEDVVYSDIRFAK